jgi:hypothetical protein
MRSLSIIILLSVFCLTGCEIISLSKEYKSIGRFPNRTAAERMALEHLSNQYDKLPQNDYYKVSYSFDTTLANVRTSHAIWYNKAKNELAMEYDIYSGIICRWEAVDRSILNQLVLGNRGLILADSLANPGQNHKYSRCF